MGLGTKSRQKQTADTCKQHLQEKYGNQLGLVEEFIVEIEGPPKGCDITRWGQFTDIKDIKKEMLKRLEAHFEKLLIVSWSETRADRRRAGNPGFYSVGVNIAGSLFVGLFTRRADSQALSAIPRRSFLERRGYRFDVAQGRSLRVWCRA
jgi:hypothetical protein